MQVDVIIIAGEANALGRGLTAEDVPASYVAGHSNVRIYNPTSGTFVQMVAGTNTGVAGTDVECWGPEVAFGEHWYADNRTSDLYIIKYTATGVGLDQSTTENDWHPSSTGDAWDLTSTRIAAAKSVITGAGDTAKVRAVIWVHGETDAGVEAKALDYNRNLVSFLNAIRDEWGDADTRLILTRVSAKPDYDFAAEVRRGQTNVASLAENVLILDTDTLPMQDDITLYAAGGQIRIGTVAYERYKESYGTARDDITASGSTEYLGLTLLNATDSAKAAILNQQLAILEEASNDTQTFDAGSGNVTCTLAVFRTAQTLIVENHSVTRTLTIPANKRVFTVVNRGTGALNITVSGGSTITLPAISCGIVVSDGTTPEFLTLFDNDSASGFELLTDAFSFSGQAGNAAKVNATADGLEAVAPGSETLQSWDTTTEWTGVTAPTNTAGGVIPFARSRMGAHLGIVPANHAAVELQPHLAKCGYAAMTLSGVSNGNPTILGLGCALSSSAGTGNDFGPFEFTNNVGANISFSNLYHSIGKYDLQVFTANTVVGRYTTQPVCAIGGGFSYTAKFGLSGVVPTTRAFVGLTVSGADMTASTTPSTNLTGAYLAMVKDQSETTWRIVQRGIAGAVKLNTSFPANTSGVDFYVFRMFCSPGGTVYYSILRMNTGAVYEGSFVAGTDMPTNTEPLYMRYHASNTTGSANYTWIGVNLIECITPV